MTGSKYQSLDPRPSQLGRNVTPLNRPPTEIPANVSKSKKVYAPERLVLPAHPPLGQLDL
jgi:hypothetical protein